MHELLILLLSYSTEELFKILSRRLRSKQLTLSHQLHKIYAQRYIGDSWEVIRDLLNSVRDFQLLWSLHVFETFLTRSTGTVHISAKARLTSVTIRIRHPNCHQNLILFIGPLPTFPENFMQIRCEVFAKKTDVQRRLHILLGGGKYYTPLTRCSRLFNRLSAVP